jgi:hypothetical protein
VVELAKASLFHLGDPGLNLGKSTNMFSDSVCVTFEFQSVLSNICQYTCLLTNSMVSQLACEPKTRSTICVLRGTI